MAFSPTCMIYQTLSVTERDGTLFISCCGLKNFSPLLHAVCVALLDLRAITGYNLLPGRTDGQSMWSLVCIPILTHTHNLLDPALEPPPADQTCLDRPMSLENGKYKITAGGAGAALPLTLLEQW